MMISLLGDGIVLVAQAWQVYDLRNDPVALSIAWTAWSVGMVAFLLTGGSCPTAPSAAGLRADEERYPEAVATAPATV